LEGKKDLNQAILPAGVHAPMPTGVFELWRTRAPKTAENIGFASDSWWRFSSGIMAESPGARPPNQLAPLKLTVQHASHSQQTIVRENC
jgi:hypothetical protein